MTLYETIFTRRAVRSYDMTVLDSAALADIQAFIDTANRLDGQSARLEIVTADKVKNDIAPYYILAHCEANDCAYMNVGYVLQNVDLHLQSNGYGSLWLGMAKPSESDSNFCIMLAFGKTSVPPRGNISEFKRLPISEISNEDNAIAQAARLSPSAVNSQPWKLDFAEGKVTIRYFGRGIMKLILKNKLSKIDLGIVTRHVDVALQSKGKAIQAITPITDKKGFAIEIEYKTQGELR